MVYSRPQRITKMKWNALNTDVPGLLQSFDTWVRLSLHRWLLDEGQMKLRSSLTFPTELMESFGVADRCTHDNIFVYEKHVIRIIKTTPLF